MKNATKHITTAIISATALLGSVSSFAQSAARASASATIITPIAITKVTDMDFGNIAVSMSAGGNVVLGASGTRTTGGSGVTLPAATGTVAAASFTITGEAGFTYAIMLPSNCTLSDGSGHTMAVNSFVSSPSAAGTLSSGGSQSLKVSATMTVSAAQAPGNYTNAGGVPVTVSYN